MNLEDYFDTERTKEKVLMIDFNNRAHAAIFGANQQYLKNVSDPNYQMSESDLYDIWKNYIVQNIFDYVKEFKPSKLIIAIDSSSWRKEVYPEYKGKRDDQRKASAVDFEKFYPVMRTLIDDLKNVLPNVYVLKVEKSEVDDIIAVLSKITFQNDEVIIVSNDKDFQQLLQYKNVKIYNPLSKVKSFVECLDPKKDLKIKVCVGDPGDNVGNILTMGNRDYNGEKMIGVGEATAEKILEEGLDSDYVIDRVGLKYNTITNEKKKEFAFDKISKEEIIKTVKENYERNLKLISFEHIPLDIQKKIQDEYSKYQLKKFSQMNLFTWLVENRIRNVADNLQTYSMFLKELH